LDQMITIQHIPLEKIRGKRILVLIDPNIEKAAPTLGSLIGKSAKLIVATHVEPPSGQNPTKLKLNFPKELSHALGLQVTKLDDAVGPDVTRAVLGIKPSEIILLENLSLYPQDAANEVTFARQLGSLCDLFIDDAFEVAHRALASNVGITRWTPVSVAGPYLASRLKELEDFCANPTRPFLAIVGGGHIESKLSLLYSLVPNTDRLFIGGALAFSFLKALGHETGRAPIEAGFLGLIQDFVRKAEMHTELVLPDDFMVGGGEDTRCVSSLSPTDIPVDIGVHSLARLTDLMNGAYSILWVGSLGICGEQNRAASDWEALQQLYAAIPRRWQGVLLAGSELLSSLSKTGDSCYFSHFSSFGDSALSVVAGQRLPAIEALHVDAVRARDRVRKPVLIPISDSDHPVEAVRLLCRHIDIENAEIHLLYVHEKGSQTNDNGEARFLSQSIFAQFSRELARFGLTAHHQVVRQGDPADHILEYAEQIHAELIVMGSHKSSASRFVLRSESDKVLERAKCPVLVARLAGDRSAATLVNRKVAEKSS
jgi:phosphoglycerate kinase